MKIVHITAHKVFLGGGERLIDGWLSNSKHDSHFYAVEGGISHPNPKFKTYKTNEELAAILHTEHPDAVVVVHDPFLSSEGWLSEVKKKVWYVHGAFAFGWDVSAIPQPLFAISNYRPANVHPSWHKIFVAPVNLGVDCTKYVPSHIKHTGKKVVGIVGRVAEEKCPLYFFDFIDKFNREHPDHSFEFHYYGRGIPESDFYKAFIKRAEQTQHFNYMGFVESNEAHTIYQRFDCLIVPSLSESGSFAILEAQSCGLKVFALNRDGIPFHMASKSALCENYDQMFKELGYFKRRDAQTIGPYIRNEILRKHELKNWVYKLDCVAEIAAFI